MAGIIVALLVLALAVANLAQCWLLIVGISGAVDIDLPFGDVQLPAHQHDVAHAAIG